MRALYEDLDEFFYNSCSCIKYCYNDNKQSDSFSFETSAAALQNKDSNEPSTLMATLNAIQMVMRILH